MVTGLEESFPIIRNPVTSLPYTIESFMDSLHFISSSPIFCSLVSYFVRAERFEDESAPESVKYLGIIKELNAALQPDIPQRLSYHHLSIPGRNESLHGNAIGQVTLQMWRSGVNRLKQLFHDQSHIFMPFYNRRRNLGYLTQDYMFQLSDSGSSVLSEYNLTSADAVRLYHETGTQIPGPMEMRFAWRYNDLSGRTYYACGGDAIWAGLYIKQLAKDLLNLLPSTGTFTRYDSHRVTFSPLREGEVILTYDYSSFTTSLAELKYFLTYLARQLVGVEIRVLDVYEGILSYDLGSYIDEYNKTINHHAEFDITRLDFCEFATILVQTRNGMLGAQGNIAFSTLLHGLSVSGISDDPAQTCVVGDDALLRVWHQHIASAILAINTLGSIERTKTHEWDSNSLYGFSEQIHSENQAYQFLKRPLRLDANNHIVTGFIPTFPNIAEAILEGDGYHVSNEMPFEFLLQRFARQWARYLTEVNLSGHQIDNDEAEIVLAVISSIYDRFNIDRKGLPNGTSWSFKGRHDKTYHTVTNMTFPPCTPEVFSTEWTELIATRYYRGTYVSIPLLVDHSIPAGPCYGLGHIVELCTLHRIQRIMSDLGYMEIENLKRTICLSEETLEDYQDVLLGNSLLRTCHRITCIKEPPEWYNVVIADEGPA
jgi:hypothetical protein